MSRYSSLFLLTFLFSTTTVVNASVSCVPGFGKSITKIQIPDSRINDGYCDCPLDAADEPDTDACAGSIIGGWAGVAGVQEKSPHQACPQQPWLVLPLSRWNDGICDCCDGADESSGDCPDNCEEILREQRLKKEKAEADFSAGHAQRQRDLKDFQTLVKETWVEIKKVEGELVQVEEELDQSKAQREFLLQDSYEKRLANVQEAIAAVALSQDGGNSDSDTSITGLLEPLSNDQLVQLVIHTCQLAGEMEDGHGFVSKKKTCVPLRLAGLDLGLVWKEEDYGQGTVDLEEDSEDLKRQLAEVWDINRQDDSEKVWSIAKLDEYRRRNPHHRRLDEYMEDDDDHYNDDYMGDDDYMGERHDDDYHYQPPPTTTEEEEMTETQKELLNEIQQKQFSQLRVSFLTQSAGLLSKMDDLTKEEEPQSGEDGDAADEQTTDDAAQEAAAAVDPMAFNMARNILNRRQASIRRGFDSAVSAQLLLSNITDRQLLLGLALMTLYHSKIALSDVWQILVPILFPAEVSPPPLEEGSCASPFAAAVCPPRAVLRGDAWFPPAAVLTAAEQWCQRRTATAEQVCVGAASSVENIPTEIPDGFAGYYVVSPRSDDDGLVRALSRLDASTVDGDQLTVLQDTLQTLENKKNDLRKQLDDLEKKIGGRDSSKFGIDGELYPLADECLSVEANKYTYEVCVFGSAAQKDGGSSTNLGRWTGMEIETETGIRILKWENGAKCWNGPMRSATVRVSCGAEHEVLSADEPDTCRYVLEMTSPIACDDQFKERMGL